MEVTVAMITYNGAEYIREQLNSILTQNLKPDEVVISDDGSTDGTLDILYEFRDRYPDLIRIDAHGQGLGPNKNSWRSLQQSTGDLVGMADQDDVWHPDKLKRQVAAFQNNPDISISCHDLQVTDKELTPLTTLWETKGYDIEEYLSIEEWLPRFTRSTFIARPTMVIRSDLIPLLKPPSEDWLHDHLIGIIAATQGSLHLIDKPLLQYRQHDANDRGAPVNFSPAEYIKFYINNRDQINGIPSKRLDRWQEAAQHLQSYSNEELNGYKPAVMEEIHNHVEYHKSRARCFTTNEPHWRKLKLIAQNYLNGYYQEYSRSTLSMVKDIVEATCNTTTTSRPSEHVEKVYL